MAQGEVRIGTSGWHYRHWLGTFYDKGTRPAELLKAYAERFDTVEVNATFYRLIETRTLERWREQTPEDFLFACKGSRYLTHMKRLKDPETAVGRYFERVQALEVKLGPIVFQLPGRFKPDRERLARFIDALPKGQRYAFEFRDPAWFTDDVLALLRERQAALCLYEIDGKEAPLEVTADFVYIRLHGPGRAYQGSYDDQALALWAERVEGWAGHGLDVFCYFDNDEKGFAPKDALRLKELLRPD
jgi:uncharacterized protein YecE (DUF72 family)